jgi:DNA primase
LLSRNAAAFRGRAEDKSRAAATLFPYLAALDSEVSRDECIARIAEAAGVERSSVASDWRRFQSGQPPRIADAPETQASGLLRPSGELSLMAAVFLNPDFFGELRARVSEDEFSDPRAKELYAALEDWWRRNLAGEEEGQSGDRRFGELFSALEDPALKGFLLRQSAGGAFDNPSRIIGDGIAMVKRKSLARRRAEIVRLLRAGGDRQDELLTEKTFIDAELAELKK